MNLSTLIKAYGVNILCAFDGRIYDMDNSAIECLVNFAHCRNETIDKCKFISETLVNDEYYNLVDWC